MFYFIELAVSAGVLVTVITALTACVWGCRNSNQKSELVGTAGVVKLRFEEETPSPTPTTPASVKRASTQNSHRSLPEIPHPVGRHDSGDTTSEIYATVNIDQGNTAIPSTSNGREHPYEHAYAKLQNENHVSVEIAPDEESANDLPIDEREVTGPESVVISASVAISGQLPSSQELPYITPPQHNEQNVQHFSGDSTDSAKGYTSISVREPLSNIRAQSKVTQQPHYATVSDDSDEMYAAIDDPNAEGGSETYAQIAPQETREREVDVRRSLEREPNPRNSLLATDNTARRSAPPEMAAVSNATHSRQASSSSCSTSGAILGSPKPEKRQANSPLPPPPLVPPPAPPLAAAARRSPLPQALAQRQQRNSSTGDLHLNHDKMRRSLNEKHQRNNSCVSSSDFYGCNYPVDKHRFSSGDLIRPLVAKELNFDIDHEPTTDNLYNSIEAPGCSDYSTDANNTSSDLRVTESPSRNLEEMYAKVMKKKGKDEPGTSKDKSKFRGDDPGYETIDRKKSMNHGYETIPHKDHKRKSSQNDPGYETVKEVKTSNYANNNMLKCDSGPNSLISSDPGYEHINRMDNSASDSDPNYEVLRNQPPTPPYATISPNYQLQPTYSTVHKKTNKFDWSENNNEGACEPNYESMPHEPLYTTGSESDPNYESVRPKDANYESVSTHDPNYESLRLKDPKYESVRSKDSRRSKDPNYESVKYFDVDSTEPRYERVNRSDSNSGYEPINVANARESKSSINGVETVSDYFQV